MAKLKEKIKAARLKEIVATEPGAGEVFTYADPASAYAAAHGRAGENDRIIVFGSFLTVAGVMQVLNLA